MNNRLLTLTLLTGSALFITGCSDDSPFETSSLTGADNEIEPANTVITEIADLNSFSVSQEIVNIEALGVEGNTSGITVRVADRHNNPVPNNTAVKFLTNAGSVEPQCLTTDGVCSVTWTEQIPTPASFEAIIIAYTTGEESFTDLNDNDQYDAVESFSDISEPFFDLDGNGVRDPATEEFVDADGDNTFDTADGLFTGTPCVGDTTVCDRRSTLIWSTANIGLVSSNALIAITSGAVPTGVDAEDSLEITVTDVNGNPMPDGTTVKISSPGGTVDPSTWNFAPDDTTFPVFYTADDDVATSERLTIEVTTESGLTTRADF